MDEQKKKAPLWQRQPLWWKLFDWTTDYILAWYLIALSPVWLPVWLAMKIHKSNERIRKDWEARDG